MGAGSWAQGGEGGQEGWAEWHGANSGRPGSWALDEDCAFQTGASLYSEQR